MKKIGYVKNGKFIEEIPNKFDDSSNSSSFSLNNENEANTSFDCNNINIIIENQLKNNGIYMTAEEYLKIISYNYEKINLFKNMYFSVYINWCFPFCLVINIK